MGETHRPLLSDLPHVSPWRRRWQPTPVFLPRESHGQRSLVGYSPWVAKRRTRLSDFIFTFSFKGGFPGDSDSKESACNAEDPGSVSRLGRSPGEGHGNPLQYSCLENLMDRGLVGYSPWGHKESDMTERLLSLSLSLPLLF